MVTRGFTVFLALLRIAAGLSLLLAGLHKLSWFGDIAPLKAQLATWAAHPANALIGRYLTLVEPRAGLFARLVVIGELGVGALLIVGFLTPLAALLGFLMTANFAFASGQLFTLGFYTGTAGIVYVLAFLVIFAGKGGTALGIDGMFSRAKMKSQ